jgi:hypothetical protein
MSSCRFKKNDYIANKMNAKEVYFIVGVQEFDCVLRREDVTDLETFTDDDLMEMETHEVNNKFTKVDIETYRLLYKDEEENATVADR